MTTYYLLCTGALVSRVLPLGLLYAVAAFVARLAALLPSGARAAARSNIAQVTGRPACSREVRRAAAAALRYQALNYVDLIRIERLTRADMDVTLGRGDLRSLLDLLAQGQGVIIVAAHLGNMDLVVQWLALRGFPIHAPMERLHPEKLLALVRRQREAAGMQVHPIGPDVLGSLSAALRAGGVVAIPADRDIGASGRMVPFFGRPARLPAGPALLALRTGAPIIAAFGRRLPDNRLFVTISAPTRLPRTHRVRDDLDEGMRVVARLIEDGIRATPEQWVVFEPIWPDATEDVAA